MLEPHQLPHHLKEQAEAQASRCSWVCGLIVQCVSVDLDADRGTGLNTNPNRTADRGLRTDNELIRKPEDSNTHHRESVLEPHTCPLTTIARIHSKCQEANISSRIWFLSRLSSQGPGLGSLWIDYSEIFSLQPKEIKVKGLQTTFWPLELGFSLRVEITVFYHHRDFNFVVETVEFFFFDTHLYFDLAVVLTDESGLI